MRRVFFARRAPRRWVGHQQRGLATSGGETPTGDGLYGWRVLAAATPSILGVAFWFHGESLATWYTHREERLALTREIDEEERLEMMRLGRQRVEELKTKRLRG